MIQAQNQVYNAFKEAGLEKEARQLSETIDGKVVPGLGHYIAVLDSNKNLGYELIKEATVFINDFLVDYRENFGLRGEANKGCDNLCMELLSKLNTKLKK